MPSTLSLLRKGRRGLGPGPSSRGLESGARTITAIALAVAVSLFSATASAEGAEGPAAAEGAEPEMGEVREAFARGSMLFDAGDYEGALGQFERARELLRGHPWEVRAIYNVGRCQEHLYRYDLALETYREYGELAGEGDQHSSLIQERIDRLEQVLATAHLQVSVPEYEVWVDGRLVGQSLPSVRFPGGAHRIEVRAEGSAPETRDVEVQPRGEATFSFDLQPLVRGVHRAYFWTAASLAVASAIVGIGLGSYALTEHDRLSELADDETNRWLVTDEDNARTGRFALAADIGFGVAGLFAVTATVLAFFTDWGREPAASSSGSTAPEGASSSLRLAPGAMGRAGAGLVLGGTFR